MVNYTYNFPNATTPDEILVSLSSSVPIFPIMVLFFIWFVVFLGGSTRQINRIGQADIPQWSLFASISIFLVSLIMTITAGIIPLSVLAVVTAITLLNAVWFFLSEGRFE